MKRLQDYIAESQQWFDDPAVGDDFAINIREECLLESHVIDVTEDSVVIEADSKFMAMLEQYGMLEDEVLEDDIQRYGPAGASMSQGWSMNEQDMEPDDHLTTIENDKIGVEEGDLGIGRILELAGLPVGEDEPLATPANANANDPLLGKAVDDAAVQPMEEGVRSSIDMDLQHIARTGRMDALVDAMRGEFGIQTQQYLQDMMDEVDQSLERRGMRNADIKTKLGMLMDRVRETHAQEDLGEAEYQGRDVPLGKPMQGDVAKFKVYVRDPKTGNVKKVNFGDKTMRIKKSNPARRKSFRARHRCSNPGPRTKARYWSCRKW
jgi:hypothetical protein